MPFIGTRARKISQPFLGSSSGGMSNVLKDLSEILRYRVSRITWRTKATPSQEQAWTGLHSAWARSGHPQGTATAGNLGTVVARESAPGRLPCRARMGGQGTFRSHYDFPPPTLRRGDSPGAFG